MKALPTFSLLGTRVSAVDLDAAVAFVEAAVRERVRTHACVCSVNMVMTARRDPLLRRALDTAGLVTPDGYPLTRIGRKRAGTHVGRVRGTDFTVEVCRRLAAAGARVYLYGGHEGVPGRVAERLRALAPGLRIVGAESPPFRPLTTDETKAMVERINRAAPDVVWVGLGCPKQEAWMVEFRDHLEAPVLVGVGAAFDFLAGTKKAAPRWVQRLALEWLWRLAHEPRRLWRRVFLEGPAFLWLAMREGRALRRGRAHGPRAEGEPGA